MLPRGIPAWGLVQRGWAQLSAGKPLIGGLVSQQTLTLMVLLLLAVYHASLWTPLPSASP
eukprot:1479030-Karenia_brevis.AAC.1